MSSDRAEYDRGPPRSPLRVGFWMQFWAGVYALHRVYPQPRLTAFVVGLLVVLVALIYDSRPAAVRGGSR